MLTKTWPIHRSCLRGRRGSSDHDGVQTHTNRQQREVLVDITNEESVNEGKPITHFQTTGILFAKSPPYWCLVSLVCNDH